MDTVAIVDDESLILYSLSSLFRGPGARVIAVDNGKAALEALQQNRIGLCFLDIHLPDVNGLDLLWTFREVSPWTRIIVMTGSIVTNEMKRRIVKHAHCLIAKPFDLDRVRSVATRLLSAGNRSCLPADEGLCVGGEDDSIQWMSNEARKQPRKTTGGIADCFAVDPRGDQNAALCVHAEKINVGDNGMCLAAGVDLPSGHLVAFDHALERRQAVVRWSRQAGDKRLYHFGVQFVSEEHIPLILRADATFHGNSSPGLSA